MIKLSIIIPFSQNEKDISLLFDIKKKFKNYEIIFVGSSKNDFVKKNINIIKKISKVYFIKNSNRAKCLNFGAYLAENELLWFIHLDSKILDIPSNFIKEIDLTKINSFKLKFKNKKFLLNYIGANLRSKILKNPFGDQSYLMTKDIFFYVNMFDERLQEAEDHEFIIRSVCKKVKINILPHSIISSERKYIKKGHIFLTFIYFYKTFFQMINFFLKNIKFLKIDYIIIVFTKFPFSKDSKSRLRSKLSNSTVNKLNKYLQEKTFTEIKKINSSSFVLALQITNLKKQSLEYFNNFSKILISKKNLGLAMQKIYKFFKFKFKKIIFIGTDTPELKAEDIKNSVKMLNYYNNYFIRTKDGGFCLFASKDKWIDDIFPKVQYSKKDTFKKFSKLTKNKKVSDFIYEDIDRPNQAIKFIGSGTQN